MKYSTLSTQTVALLSSTDLNLNTRVDLMISLIPLLHFCSLPCHILLFVNLSVHTDQLLQSSSCTVSIYGKTVSSKNDCLDNCDKLLYSWLPICIICFKSSGLPIPFIIWYINAHKLIATHCCPAFCPNTTTSPWLYGAFIVLLGSTWCRPGLSLYHFIIKFGYKARCHWSKERALWEYRA